MGQHLNREESPKQNVRVFINYAHEDFQAAQRLYQDLKDTGLDPWLDRNSLVPGQNWESAIRGALKNSRYFIPLFSTISVGKLGFTLKEFKFALEVISEFPDIFVIPVRLDNCEIPYERFRSIQYVDLFPSWNDGLQKILKITGVKYKELEQKPSFNMLVWDELLTSIYEKKCIPFIGTEVHTPWIPQDLDIAREWAAKYDYPLEVDELSKVSLYLGIAKGDEYYPKMLLSKITGSIQPPNFEESGDTLYRVLAKLDLPIYITTNYDHFMEEALKSIGKSPVSEFCRWSEKLLVYTKKAGISSPFDKGRMYIPTAAEPLVYHLYGDFEVPQSMVLTEKDYFDFLINVYREDEKIMFPSVIRRALATSLLLFMGYEMSTLSFRIMLGSIAAFTNPSYGYQNIGIFLPPEDKRKYYLNYLNQYAKSLFNVRIYWSENSSFSRDLHKQWEKFMITKVQSANRN